MKAEGKVKTESADDADDDDMAGANTIDEMEKTMIGARSGLRASKMKRPAVANSGKMKRPAATTSSITSTKKPAAATPSISKKPAARNNIGTWKNINSGVWHRVRDAVVKKCKNETKARTAATQACARAQIKSLNGTLKIG